ncbi:hypothetical protein G5714_016498 [Onychostoma macrolepis]|uniref:Protein kinase domain-containing protein n=1 Tax=Onychostoma macrolepis TaxID=369639 RepID=A0A7J6CAH9_9TELE|nr:hypothetical protein G5714_016498 [Onychostoma macrolepis]
MRKKKGTCAFFWQTWRAVKRTVLYCYRGNKVDPEPFSVKPVAQQDQANPQPGLSSLDLVLTTDPCPSGLKSESTTVPGAPSVEMTRNTDPADPEPSSVSGPSSLQLTPDSDPTSPDSLPVPAPSGLEPMAPQDLADPQTGAFNLELTLHTDLVDSQQVNVSPQSNLELTPDPDPDPDPEPEPVPGPSGLHTELTSHPGPYGFGPAVGSFFSLYDVGVSLGSGNFGTVYEGTRRSDGQKVAIKLLTKVHRVPSGQSYGQVTGCFAVQNGEWNQLCRCADDSLLHVIQWF